MATPKQIEANRRNALKSTGPRTTEGKERSRINATTHGCTAVTTIYQPLRHEDPAVYQELRASLIADWNPVGTAELLAIEMIASAYKRVQRIDAMESAFFDGAMELVQARHNKPMVPTSNDNLGSAIVLGALDHKLTWENLDRYRRHAWLDYNRAVEQLRRLQKDRTESEARELRASTRIRTDKPLRATKLASFRHLPNRLGKRQHPAANQRASSHPR